VLRKNDVSAPHTAHCLPSGNVMISTMGDKDGNAKGEFILFDKDFECAGLWTSGETALCGYDYWYQPYFNVMIASEWGAPRLFRRGFDPEDLKSDRDYGRRLNVYAWNERKLIDTIDLGEEGKSIYLLALAHTHMCT
jgi:selenium-binding protein 1